VFHILLAVFVEVIAIPKPHPDLIVVVLHTFLGELSIVFEAVFSKLRIPLSPLLQAYYSLHYITNLLEIFYRTNFLFFIRTILRIYSCGGAVQHQLRSVPYHLQMAETAVYPVHLQPQTLSTHVHELPNVDLLLFVEGIHSTVDEESFIWQEEQYLAAYIVSIIP
jgi:hypothetical protein